MRTNKTPWPITELEQFYKTATLPKTYKVGTWQVNDVKKFVESHLRYVKTNKQKASFKPYLVRLEEFRNFIKTNL